MTKKFESVEERRAYNREWYKNNKHRAEYKEKHLDTARRLRQEWRDWFKNFKKDLACTKCGIADWRVLDFHHKDAEDKILEVSNMVRLRWSKEKILLEVAKCDCLCSNCHRIVHWEEKGEMNDELL